jgi:hypothetical protein
MDLQTAAKLPFNLKIIPVNENGIPNGLPFLAMFNPETIAITENIKWAAQWVELLVLILQLMEPVLIQTA